MKILTLFLFATLLVPQLAISQGLIGGWMQGKGRTAVALTYFTDSFNRYYVGQQQTHNPQLGTIAIRGLSLYLGTGVTDWLDVVANVPYASASSDARLWETIGGMQDLQAGIRIRPVSVTIDGSRLDFMLAGVYSTPISSYVNDAPVTIGHQASGIDGRVVAQLTATNGLFVMAQTGYMARGRVMLDRGFEVDVPDAIDFVARAGWGSSSIYADVWLQNIVAQSGTNIGPGVPFPSNAQASTRVGATVAYRLLSELSLIGGIAGTLSGRNVGHATRFSFGVAYDLPMWDGVSL